MKYLSFICLLITLSLTACQNKFLPKFYRIDAGFQRQLQLDETFFMKGFRISEKPAENLYRSGTGILLVTNQSQIDSSMTNLKSGLVTVDARIRYQIAVELPENLKADSLDIERKSVCLFIGRYDLPDSLKVYRCDGGYILIDSVKSSAFSAKMNGIYVNLTQDTLRLSGALKAKRRK